MTSFSASTWNSTATLEIAGCTPSETGLGLIVAIVAFATHHPWYALLWIPLGYGFAWAGHFLMEKNTPATLGHPFWSFISDFRVLGLMLTGRL
jgi:hypothetical protein